MSPSVVIVCVWRVNILNWFFFIVNALKNNLKKGIPNHCIMLNLKSRRQLKENGKQGDIGLKTPYTLQLIRFPATHMQYKVMVILLSLSWCTAANALM